MSDGSYLPMCSKVRLCSVAGGAGLLLAALDSAQMIDLDAQIDCRSS